MSYDTKQTLIVIAIFVALLVLFFLFEVGGGPEPDYMELEYIFGF